VQGRLSQWLESSAGSVGFTGASRPREGLGWQSGFQFLGYRNDFPAKPNLMTRRSGRADLPLHGGRVPQWLADRMSSLGAVVCQAIVHHYGREELLARLAHPFWFQSFGAVMGWTGIPPASPRASSAR
jgi:hypothetical protein